MATKKFCEITPEILELSELSKQASYIPPELYSKYDVKRGLRDINGKGVLVGLTEIADVCSTEIVNGESVPAEGKLFYRGYNVQDLVRGIEPESHFDLRNVPTCCCLASCPRRRICRIFAGSFPNTGRCRPALSGISS